MRLDKWLWAARFFKTRSLAQAAVTGGKVKLKGERVKAAKEIAPGAQITIRIGELEWTVTVVALSDKRRRADVARELYEEDEASRARRIAQVADRRAQASVWGERKGRPTKRDRREWERWQRGRLTGTLIFVALAGALLEPGTAAGSSYAEMRAAAVKGCEAIDPAEYQTGLMLNPDGYRSYYVRSRCFQGAAVQFRDDSLCAQVSGIASAER